MYLIDDNLNGKLPNCPKCGKSDKVYGIVHHDVPEMTFEEMEELDKKMENNRTAFGSDDKEHLCKRCDFEF